MVRKDRNVLTNGTSGYTPLIQLLKEIGRARDADATVAALAMIYVGLDTMALLACPLGQQSQTRGDFIAWVNRYLRADPTSDYQYEGIDVYAARCAVLHRYGSVASLHTGPNPPRKFGYLDNGPHRVDETERLVLISVAVLEHDFSKAVKTFVTEMKSSSDLKRRVDSRIKSLFFNTLLHE
jgi:hypothetical protein